MKTQKSEKLKAENEALKGFKEQCLEMLRNVGYGIGKVLKLEDVKESVKQFSSRLFSAFINENQSDFDKICKGIGNGQDYKLQQIEQQHKKQADIEQQLEKSMGIGSKSKAQEQDYEKGGRGR